MSIYWNDPLHSKTWNNDKEVLRLYLYVKYIHNRLKKQHKNVITEQSDKVKFISTVNMLTAYV